MPTPRELLETAMSYERTGLHDRALAAFARARESTLHPALVSEALRHEADIHRARCEWEEALTAARRSATIAGEAGLKGELAEALNAEAAVFLSRGDFAAAQPLLRRILELPVKDRIRGIAYQNLALVSAQAAEHDTAERYFRESVEYFRRAGYARGETISLVNLGRNLLDRQNAEAAVPLLREAERRALRLGDLDLLAMSRMNYAEALMESGEVDRAFELTCTALGHFDTTRNAYRRVECLRILGDIHKKRGESADARSCYQTALTMAERIEARAEIGPLTLRLEVLG